MQVYDFQAIEKKWQQYWEGYEISKTDSMLIHPEKPKYYILNMFPYPSGSGLHVGHCLGYVATDIVARYKKSQGYHVLNPMGFDAFGLPTEQYAIQTGQHPEITTSVNIKYYKTQLKQLGLSFDWSREICTSDPLYYKWTQWIFLQMFHSWYDKKLQKARPIAALITLFKEEGNLTVQAACDSTIRFFTGQEWNSFSSNTQQNILLQYRIAYIQDVVVNWCPELGTVLANEEVKEGLSERGGHPVIRTKMKQWCLRMTAYAERLLQDLESLDWPTSTKEMQRYWIGRSQGMKINFQATLHGRLHAITVFTTRPDTIFGVSYLALAPEHPLVQELINNNSSSREIYAYLQKVQNRTERERITEKPITGIATGIYARHPLTGHLLPVWIADYVVATYGTGAIMGVPAHDSRDYAFAQQFNLSIISVISDRNITEGVYEGYEGRLINSEFLNNLTPVVAAEKVVEKLEKLHIGERITMYRVHDLTFSRQRYWGEPFPICYQGDIPTPLSVDELPLQLPLIHSYKPTQSGKSPLNNALFWKTAEGFSLETATMPGWAGSSWYFLRYMDPHNNTALVDKKIQKYWNAVDLYVGGAEHATGHLLYARFWTKFLYDLEYINIKEPFQQLIHQGMIYGNSSFVYRIKHTQQFVSYNLRTNYETITLHIPSDFVENNILNINALRAWHSDFKEATFILEEGQYICGSKVEKMSKSKNNTITPDSVINQYGADVLRLYLMFLGPIEQSKPWDVRGIDGVSRFVNKLWRLFHTEEKMHHFIDAAPTLEELKIIHKAIQKVDHAIQTYSFNTAVSALMICVNELTILRCSNKIIFQYLLLILAPFAPHITAELWERLGNTTCIATVPFPTYDEQYLQEELFQYPIAINGKVRTQLSFRKDMPHASIEERVLDDKNVQKWIQNASPKRIIIVSNKMINIVV